MTGAHVRKVGWGRLLRWLLALVNDEMEILVGKVSTVVNSPVCTSTIFEGER